MSNSIRSALGTLSLCLATLALGACTADSPTAPEVPGLEANKTRTSTNYTLSVSRSGTGQGTLTSSPAGINCGPSSNTCSATFASGTVVTLTATPSEGSAFGSWGGACSGTSSSCTVTMSSNRSVTATFAALAADSYDLNVSFSGGGQGTVTTTDLQVTCASGCSAKYPAGSTVTLLATPAAGSVFGGWSGACSGTSSTCTVTISGPTNVSATFTTAPSPSHISIPAAYRVWRIRDWSVDIDVAAHANDPTIQPGAVITVQLSGGLNGTKTCTTSTTGVCRILSGAISNKATSITFTITNVSLSGYAYDATLNHNLNPGNLGVTSSVTVTGNNAVTFLK